MTLPTAPHNGHKGVVPKTRLGAGLRRFDRCAGDVGRAWRGEREAATLWAGWVRCGGGADRGAVSGPRRGGWEAAAFWAGRIGGGCRFRCAVHGGPRRGVREIRGCGRGWRHGFAGGRRSRQGGEGQHQQDDEQSRYNGDTHGGNPFTCNPVATIIARFGIAR